MSSTVLYAQGMKRRGILTALLCSATLILCAWLPASGASPKSGQACKVIGQKIAAKAQILQCKKVGNRKVWQVVKASKPAVTHKPAPPPPVVAPVMPTSFADLHQNRSGVSWAAWKAVNSLSQPSVAGPKQVDVFTGPNTKPVFENYDAIIKATSEAFPNATTPQRLIVLRFSFADIQWAEEALKDLTSSSDYAQLQRNEGGQIIAGNCNTTTKDCLGARLSTTNAEVAYFIEGVPNALTGRQLTHRTSGELAVHEYFHALQSQTQFGRPGAFSPWRLRWLLEGSAQWAQMAVTYRGSYELYKSMIRSSCDAECKNLTEEQLLKYLQSGPSPSSDFSQWLSYSVGSQVIEILVALKGQHAILALHERMANGLAFEAAFKDVFEVEWSQALPEIARTIAVMN